jgi:predicted  nucleic acid-binding Zn-ribbon protein
MDESFQLLEEKVRRAAELLTRLRNENDELRSELGRLRPKLQETEKKVDGLEKARSAGAAESRQLEALGREVRGLREEREEVRRRISRLVEVLDGLDRE